MTDGRKELPLFGGRVTSGVVRVGDTVRKPATENSAFVRRLLRHLTKNGSDFTPRFLGIDRCQRDTLTFIDGDVPGDLSYFDERTLCNAAILIRRFHDLSSELVASQNVEVVCHNDLSPCNFVFRSRSPVAIIDFDAAAPGSRAHDLGYAAWLWLDLGSTEIGASEQRRRLAVFLNAYGAGDCGAVLEATLDRQSMLIEEGRRTGNESLASWASGCKEWTRRNWRTLRNA